jgi:thioredoxin-related protein
MKILVATILFMVFASIQWLTDFEAARQSAASDHKYILLNFSGSDWCGPCIKMKQEVFESEEFSAIAEKELVLVRADFPRAKKNKLSPEQTKHNEELAEKYNPSGFFPYTVLLDANGKILKEWNGYVFGSQDKFIADLKKTVPVK